MDFFVLLTFDCLSFLHNASWRNLRHSISSWDTVLDLRFLHCDLQRTVTFKHVQSTCMFSNTVSGLES